MTTDEYRTQITLRQMAWQRAKGELLSILETYWNGEADFERLQDYIMKFIDIIENESPLA